MFSTELVDKDGDIFYTLGGENREYAEANEYPYVMINAMMAIEDQRFNDHFGIDPLGDWSSSLWLCNKSGTNLLEAEVPLPSN